MQLLLNISLKISSTLKQMLIDFKKWHRSPDSRVRCRGVSVDTRPHRPVADCSCLSACLVCLAISHLVRCPDNRLHRLCRDYGTP